MTAKADPEHVVALALQPIRALIDVPNAIDLERSFGQLRLDANEAPVRKRPQLPYNLDRHVRVAILHSSHVAEEVVLLRLIIVQPADNFVRRRRVDVHDRLAPDHFDALDARGELLLKRLRGWIRLSAPMLNVSLCRQRSAGCTGSGP